MSNLPPLPPGFVLQSGPAIPPPPAGFILSQPEADPRENAAGKVDAFGRGIADTLSFGTADELAAQMRSGPFTVQEKPDDYYSTGIYSGDWNPLGRIAKALDAPFASPTKTADYDMALAEERATDASDAKNRLAERLAGQILGAVGGGAALAKQGLSATANAVKAGKGLKGITLASMKESAALGGLSGFGSGEGVEDRLKKAVVGTGIGAGAGLVLPGATAVVGGAVNSLTRPVRALFQPEEFSQRALSTYLARAGKTPEEVADSMRSAIADDQSMYSVADAMGNAGQRALVPAVRTPNDIRQQLTDQLLGRQLDQGRRVASSLTDASGTTWTPDRMREVLKAGRSLEAERNYGPVRTDPTAIDVSDAVDIANRAISPAADRLAKANSSLPTDLAARAGIESGESSIRDPIRQALKEARSYLASNTNTVTNVEKAFRAKTNIDAMIAKATENQQGAMVEALKPVQQALDDALANTSKTYATARDAYRTASGNIDAIDVGRELARPRNRVDDNLATFQSLTSDQQKGARVGYFDPYIAKAEQNAGTMANSARPFMSDSARRELPAFAAPGQGDLLMRRLAREQQMSETTAHALGNSRTADNVADLDDAANFDPEILSNILAGRWGQAAMSGVRQGVNLGKGLPPRVVERIGKTLMETDPEAALSSLKTVQAGKQGRDRLRAAILSMLLNGSNAGVARLP